MCKNLDALVSYATSYDVLPVANVVLEDPHFTIWSGSSKPTLHHYGQGGLIQHTREVVELCIQTNQYFKPMGKGVDERLLFLAALFHDMIPTIGLVDHINVLFTIFLDRLLFGKRLVLG